VKGVFRGHFGCGGSTITQQVVKTFLLQSEWRPKRKLKELVLAPRLERNLSKDEILFLYLNQIYFGHRRYGVEEASRFYFGKGVRQLSVGEAATIAGVVQSPERLSPVKHPQAAKERQRYVLRRMAEEGFISRQVAEAELARPITVARRDEDPPGAWYADAVRRYLDERYGADRVETDGLVVDVAMDPRAQRAAEEALEEQLRAIDRRQGWRGPIAHLDDRALASALPPWRERLKAARARPGEVVSTAGAPLGRHDGIHRFTVGQRRGLGLGGGDPRYVVRLEPEAGRVGVGAAEEATRRRFTVREARWVQGRPPAGPVEALVKVRHRHAGERGRVTPTPGGAEVELRAGVRGVAPGQAAVFYDGDEVLGGGRIAAGAEDGR
jgi:hypothetical protein